ncbi:DNA-3-methyladenine glycosylase [Clostridium fallax]|uniref:Putative 3-methyladenine DNA glycosylase n=1 Tax=Clostridium fallax TaxID=1533 RepID=A0A1M4T650_9CLOT|nr:DNA-3-methyladenine glycosylase [Clostridium fallax]SHE39880.1 DNA-3-methyladenine glycosylase [Clostridium fallax]SQB22613.1 3-methyladenine DNA glycosylase [Clostridium fallax]
MKLDRKFFERDTLIVAKELLGKILVRNKNNEIIKCRIVETEAYIGPIDKACHAYGGKKTDRVKPLYGKAAVAYVYFIYGLYHCINITTGQEGSPECVLIRAVEPIQGIDYMSLNRYNEPYDKINRYKRKNLCNGPSKMTMACNITKEDNWVDLTESEDLYIENDESKFNIIEAKRIGIDYAEEAKDFLWRFYIEGNQYISKK